MRRSECNHTTVSNVVSLDELRRESDDPPRTAVPEKVVEMIVAVKLAALWEGHPIAAD